MLTDVQVRQFREDGYLSLPSLFSPEEVAVIQGEATRVFGLDRPEIQRSADGEPKAALAMHGYSEVFKHLLRHPRLVRATEELLEGEVYCHQYKIVTKKPFGRLDFPWHQDFGTWHVSDGMPEPLALNIALYLEAVTEFNGPVLFIPGSHKSGLANATPTDLPGNQVALFTLDQPTIEKLVAESGIVAPKGPAGTVVIFHGCMAHASGPNLSPWSRNIVYLTSNRVDNYIRKPTRPEYYAHTDFTPLVPLSDDCLAEFMS